MDELYELMYDVFPDVHNIREITVEAGRPDTITPEKLDVLKNGTLIALVLTRNPTLKKH